MQNGAQTNFECNLGKLRAGPPAQSRENHVQCQLEERPILRTPRRRALARHWRAYGTSEPQRSQARRGENEGGCMRDGDAARERICSCRRNARTRKKTAFQLSEEHRIAASTGDPQTYAVSGPMCDQREVYHLHGGSLSLSNEGTVTQGRASTLNSIDSTLGLAPPWAASIGDMCIGDMCIGDMGIGDMGVGEVDVGEVGIGAIGTPLMKGSAHASRHHRAHRCWPHAAAIP